MTGPVSLGHLAHVGCWQAMCRAYSSPEQNATFRHMPVDRRVEVGAVDKVEVGLWQGFAQKRATQLCTLSQHQPPVAKEVVAVNLHPDAGLTLPYLLTDLMKEVVIEGLQISDKQMLRCLCGVVMKVPLLERQRYFSVWHLHRSCMPDYRQGIPLREGLVAQSRPQSGRSD